MFTQGDYLRVALRDPNDAGRTIWVTLPKHAVQNPTDRQAVYNHAKQLFDYGKIKADGPSQQGFSGDVQDIPPLPERYIQSQAGSHALLPVVDKSTAVKFSNSQDAKQYAERLSEEAKRFAASEGNNSHVTKESVRLANEALQEAGLPVDLEHTPQNQARQERKAAAEAAQAQQKAAIDVHRKNAFPPGFNMPELKMPEFYPAAPQRGAAEGKYADEERMLGLQPQLSRIAKKYSRMIKPSGNQGSAAAPPFPREARPAAANIHPAFASAPAIAQPEIMRPVGNDHEFIFGSPQQRAADFENIFGHAQPPRVPERQRVPFQYQQGANNIEQPLPPRQYEFLWGDWKGRDLPAAEAGQPAWLRHEEVTQPYRAIQPPRPQYQPPIVGQGGFQQFAKGGSVKEGRNMSPIELNYIMNNDEPSQSVDPLALYSTGDKMMGNIDVPRQSRPLRSFIKEGAEAARQLSGEAKQLSDAQSNRALGKGLIGFAGNYLKSFSTPGMTPWGAIAHGMNPAAEAYIAERQAAEQQNQADMLAQMTFKQKIESAKQKEDYLRQKLGMEQMFKANRLGLDNARLVETKRHHKEIEKKGSYKNSEAYDKRQIDKEIRLLNKDKINIEKSIKNEAKNRLDLLRSSEKRDPKKRRAVEQEVRQEYAPYIQGIDEQINQYKPHKSNQLKSYNESLDKEAANIVGEKERLLQKKLELEKKLGKA